MKLLYKKLEPDTYHNEMREALLIRPSALKKGKLSCERVTGRTNKLCQVMNSYVSQNNETEKYKQKHTHESFILWKYPTGCNLCWNTP